MPKKCHRLFEWLFIQWKKTWNCIFRRKYFFLTKIILKIVLKSFQHGFVSWKDWMTVSSENKCLCVCTCVFVCLCVREREIEGDSKENERNFVFVCRWKCEFSSVPLPLSLFLCEEVERKMNVCGGGVDGNYFFEVSSSYLFQYHCLFWRIHSFISSHNFQSKLKDISTNHKCWRRCLTLHRSIIRIRLAQ